MYVMGKGYNDVTWSSYDYFCCETCRVFRVMTPCSDVSEGHAALFFTLKMLSYHSTTRCPTPEDCDMLIAGIPLQSLGETEACGATSICMSCGLSW